MIIRPVLPSDAKELLAIYAPYVTDTTITFEYDIPSISEFTNRIKNISKSFPYLVAEENGKILGYVYASTYYARAAYDWTCELSIYLDKDARSKKISSQLYDTLEKELVSQGYVNLLACISLPNDISIAFHKKRGFNQVAHFPKIGFKFEQWHDIVWLQKRLKS
ncbi:TPA: N-acetyltransferase [Streptococcus agalactiae]|nr:N-acetyltransferase [Streptococcus agalactiae]